MAKEVKKKPTEEPLYIIDNDQMMRLRLIEKKLFGDGTILTADKRRDLANQFNVLVGEISNQRLKIGPDGGNNDKANK